MYLLLSADPRTGIVPDADPGIALRCGLDLEETAAALDWLASPDPYSRTEDHDGRRIERTDDGRIHILNYMEHANRDYSTPRVRNWREKKKKHKGASVKKGDKCGCCGEKFVEPFNLYVTLDHNHETGEVRSYICQSCNKIVGQYENGKPVRDKRKLELAKAYVLRFSNATTLQKHQDKDKDKEKKESLASPTDPPPRRVHWDSATRNVEIDEEWLRGELEDIQAAAGVVLTRDEYERERERLRLKLLEQPHMRACIRKSDGKPSSDSQFRRMETHTVTWFSTAIRRKADRARGQAQKKAPSDVAREAQLGRVEPESPCSLDHAKPENRVRGDPYRGVVTVMCREKCGWFEKAKAKAGET